MKAFSLYTLARLGVLVVTYLAVWALASIWFDPAFVNLLILLVALVLSALISFFALAPPQRRGGPHQRSGQPAHAAHRGVASCRRRRLRTAPGSPRRSAASTRTRTAALTLTCTRSRCRHGASTCTSRTSRSTRPAASSTGSPGRCSCTRCATAGCAAGTPVIEASSGSTAVSEAYFARLIGLPFVAVMPATTSPEKIALIEFHGGRCHLVDDPGTVYDEAGRLAAESNGHYMDQFTYAERATDWRGNNNIAESIYEQMRKERHPIPAWIVVGAGTGGTSATIGRYIRYRRTDTRVCVADPEGLGVLRRLGRGRRRCRHRDAVAHRGHRPAAGGAVVRRGVIDDMMRVPDAASIATMRWVSRVLNRPVGGSTGTNLWALRRGREDAAVGRDRQRRHPVVRRRRALLAHVLQRHVAGRARHRHLHVRHRTRRAREDRRAPRGQLARD